MDDEPVENISGGVSGGGTSEEFDPADAETHAGGVVDRLGELYWQKTYGGRDAFECLVRTVLSQNTSDVASQPAHDTLMERYGSDEAPRASERSSGERERGGSEATASDQRAVSETSRESSEPRDGDLAEALADAPQDELAETISSAGLYNQKSATLIRLAERVVDEYGGERGFDEFVSSAGPATVRERLLEMKGVGPKTADCVLLFAGGRDGVFPVKTA